MWFGFGSGVPERSRSSSKFKNVVEVLSTCSLQMSGEPESLSENLWIHWVLVLFSNLAVAGQVQVVVY